MSSRKFRNASWFNAPQWFKLTDQKRPPKKGEYYLSGAKPAAYMAPVDLAVEYHILEVVPDPPKTITRDGFLYRLSDYQGD